jgi:cleavage and polyadenylation specificity factor subunit 5
MSADVASRGSPEASGMDQPDAAAIAAYTDGLVHAAGSTHGARTVHVYPVTNYSFGSKAAKPEKDATIAEAMLRHKRTYEKEGTRRTVEAVLLVNQHSHPHVLLLRTPRGFKLPGGRLRRGEGEIEGLRRKLHNTLSPVEPRLRQKEWDVGECVSRWCRPSHEPNYYPYVPSHCTRPKESRAVYLSELPGKCVFAVPKNMKLLAVPLFELYGNEQRYGALIASIPHLISRYHVQLEDAEESPAAAAE